MRNAVFTCRESDYGRIRNIMIDRDTFPATYAEWDANIEKGILARLKPGDTCVKVVVHADEFIAWCKINSRAHDSNSRGIYAGIKLGESPGPTN